MKLFAAVFFPVAQSLTLVLFVVAISFAEEPVSLADDISGSAEHEVVADESESETVFESLATATPVELTERGFTPLFNGKDLSGWRNPYDHGEAAVVDGKIHLVSDKKFFLVTDKTYSDFIVIAEIKLPSEPANSGVMFRCHVKPNNVFGYQAECDGSDRRWSAGLFDEGRRRWIWPSTKGRSLEEFLKYEAESKAFFATPKIRDALKRDDWNRFVIECHGDHIVISLNGVKVTDLHDSTDAAGYLGIQHHGEKGKTYQFRNLYIKEMTAQAGG